ncbi:MAG: hypothetical protein ACM3OB_05600 [Acidobacteriota bacterium]
MKVLARVLAVLSFAALVVWLIANEGPAASGGRPPEPAARRGPAAWRTDPIWDDHRTEVSSYAVDWRLRGEPVTGRAVLSIEREPGEGGADALRIRQVRDLGASGEGIQQRANLVLGRGDGALRRVTVASDGAGGLATAQLSRGRLELRPGHAAAEGERNLTYPAAALPEDALPVLLRDWVTDPLPPSVDVFPSLLPGDFQRLDPTAYSVSRSSAQITVPAGTFRVVELRLQSDGLRLLYDFDERAPHPLVRLVSADGGEYRLLSSERVSRAAQRRTGDAGRLPSAIR